MPVSSAIFTRSSLVAWRYPQQQQRQPKQQPSHRPHRQRRSCEWSRCSALSAVVTLLMIGGGFTCSRSMNVSAFPIVSSSSSSSSSSWKFTKRLQWMVYSNNNKNQWEDDIIISPDLSEYFSKQQQQEQKILSSTKTDTVTTTATKAVEPSSSSSSPPSSVSSSPLSDSNDVNNVLDVTNVDDTNVVKEIVATLQTTIENGSKNKNMISEIMASIQQLQRIQQQWKVQNGNKNNDDDDDDEKLILMKNPKKRSNTMGTTKAKKKSGGMSAASIATTTSTTVVTSQRSSSLPSSMIFQRLIQSVQNGSNNNNSIDDEISYRLLWVGSDVTISAFGTGLHKVPLARLQEVFLSISIPRTNRKSKVQNSRNNNQFRLTTTEVIRILGPFPNIKNTLQGKCTVFGEPNGGEQWKITWDSMIDGTGKELIGKTNDDVRQVPTLQMLYGDEQIIVASMLSESSVAPTDSMQTSTQAPTLVGSILLFVREIEMEEKLIALRVM